MSRETHEFKAEVSALLNLVTNSLYTNSEIFLRELISNASDALDKARFEALVDDSLEGKDIEPVITLTADAKNKTLTIEDTGIGMNRDEAARNLGTIAHSGTLEFLKAAKKTGKGDTNLIGQFGVGFYSAFMVAQSVEVHSKSARPGNDAVVWTSGGDGRFDLSAGERGSRGTRIVLHMRDESDEFLQGYRIENIVRRYSNYVMHPINLVVIDEEGGASEPRQINAAAAFWAKSPKDLSDDDYGDFYKHLMGGFVMPGDEPLARMHFSMDAPIQFDALLMVPGRAPADLFMEDRKALQLFARRVLIMDSCDRLLPPYLRFFRGVVDSADLPLNVSREMLQEHKHLSAIRRQLTRKGLKLLAQTASEDKDKYETLWSEFGAVIKEGLHSDSSHRDDLLALTRWKSSENEGWLSLDEYVEAMPEGQEAIYYLAGPNALALRNSPHLEALRADGFNVLLMTDAVDEWVIQSIPTYKDKPFKSASQGALEVGGDDGEAAESPIDPLLVKARALLGDRVKDVRASSRLKSSASCLVDDASGLSRNMERILRMAQQQVASHKRILELNPEHAFVQKANALAQDGAAGSADTLTTWVELLHDMAGLAEGHVDDPAGAVSRIQAVLDRVAGIEG